MAEINEFIKKRPGLVWSTTQYDKLSEEVIVEAVLNYGNFKDVNEIIRILGIKRVAAIFWEEASKKRSNLRPEVKHYFNLFFKKYVGNP
ncbi:MAG TPA: hypothetical protein PK429_00870 [Candidatus Pacearchaeota archaeon]|jgi:hypothetical protein|nr:hypothetical protein [Candidatus Pacearchaeota archaeon]HPO06500.1 hypothetical protein [Candidatus Pacearchaeota archaeon]